MNNTKTVNIVIGGEIYGTYHGSEKSVRRALTMFAFNRKESDSDDQLREDWDQICYDFGLRHQKEVVNFDLKESVFSE